MIFGKNMIDADAINQYTGNDKFTVSPFRPDIHPSDRIKHDEMSFADKEVRQAPSTRQISRQFPTASSMDFEQPADTLFAENSSILRYRPLEPYAYDVELAQSMLDEADGSLDLIRSVKKMVRS